MADAHALGHTVRTHTELLLASIGIRRIVVVDDAYSAVTVEDLIGLCSQLASADAARLPHVEGVAFAADQDVWGQQLRERWQALDERQHADIMSVAQRLQAPPVAVPDLLETTGLQTEEGRPPPRDVAGQAAPAAEPAGGVERRTDARDDTRAADALEALLSGLAECEYLTLSLADWRLRSQALLADPRADATLFLFDRDFRREQQSQDEGFALLRDVQRAAVGYCGLITHTVVVGAEYDAWSQLAAEHQLDKDRFVVIAKQRLTGTPPEHYTFLRMVRLVALSGRCAALKTAAWEVFEASVREAKAAMDRLSVLDFDQIVLAAPRREGVWEADTLFRVFSILLRQEARIRLRGDDAGLAAKADAARKVSAVPLEAAGALGTEPPCREAIRIQRFEMYEQEDFLSQQCRPIDVGDMFQGANARRYILLAQPCDLMVRPDGRRSYDDKRGRSAPLVELVTSASGSDVKPSWAEIPYYEEETGGSAFADFAKVHHVQLAVLDLCALNQDGTAAIDLEGAPPGIVIEPWKKRHADLKRLYASAWSRYAELAKKQVRDELKVLGLPMACMTASFSAAVDGRVIRYGLRRVGRLSQPRSGALLTAFAQYQSRAAFEHDLDHRKTTCASAGGATSGGGSEPDKTSDGGGAAAVRTV